VDARPGLGRACGASERAGALGRRRGTGSRRAMRWAAREAENFGERDAK